MFAKIELMLFIKEFTEQNEKFVRQTLHHIIFQINREKSLGNVCAPNLNVKIKKLENIPSMKLQHT